MQTNLVNGVHPLFLIIAASAIAAFLGVCVWTFKSRRSMKSLPVVLLLISATLTVGYALANKASQAETERRLQSSLSIANLMSREVSHHGHAKVRLDGSTKTLASLQVNTFNRWLEAFPSITAIQTVRKTPDNRLQPILKAGESSVLPTKNASANMYSSAWDGSSHITQSNTARSESTAVLPLVDPASKEKVEALLFIHFSDPGWEKALLETQVGVLAMTGILVLLAIFGGVAGTELGQTLADARVARAELVLQGQRIKEHMDLVAEKNQAMAASHDLLAVANAKLQSLATMDGLTGVMNHRTLMEFLSTNLKKNSVIGSPSSVILLDIDNFKNLNDQYGHIAGDEALRTIAQVLRQSCPQGAGVGRYGGEEFMMILPGGSESAAVAVAEELRRRIQMAKTSSRPVTASIGVSTVYSMNKSEQTLIDEADKALYVSKRSGKNRVTHFGHGMLESA
jgi:diguanylate cyclase (GGDEF)-like protein